jgi:glycerol uptake facilitator-like aquaporin
LTNQFVGLNPAAVFANQLFLGIKITNFETLANYWVYIVAPVVGCIVGSIVFNYFALPVYRTIKNKK